MRKDKVASARSVECQILEFKDLGDFLEKEDIVSPPPEFERKFLKDQRTSGKFLQVKYKIKNKRKEQIDVLDVILRDKIGRKYIPGWQLVYWIPEKHRVSSVLPGLEKEIVEIFEVPKESEEPFKLQIKISLFRFFD